MRLQAVILDAEPEHCRHLRLLLDEWAKNSGCDVGVRQFPDSESLTERRIQDSDIFFIDTSLTRGNGMEAARYIRSRSEHVPLVFVTKSRSYVFEGYTVHALRYLLKPLRAEDCFFCMNQALQYARRRDEETILLPSSGKIIRLRLSEILYIEAQVRHIRVVTAASSEEYSQTFARTLQQLPRSLFAQCHRSYLVNLRHIRMVQGSQIFLDSGEQLPIGRAHQESLLQTLGEKMELCR